MAGDLLEAVGHRSRPGGDRRRLAPVARAVAFGVVVAGCAVAEVQPARTPRVLDHILRSSVQIVLEEGGESFRSGSGVAIAARPEAGGIDCLVLTSGHTFARLPDDAVDTYLVFNRHRGGGVRVRARVLAKRDTERVDLALVQARADQCVPAPPGVIPRLGDPVWTVGFPWGRQLRLTAGIVSQLMPDEGDDSEASVPRRVLIDASVAYGSSGGGVFDARTGGFVGLVEGYGTARVSFGERGTPPYIDVPVPGETYVTTLPTIIQFLQDVGYQDVLRPAPARSVRLE